MLKVCIFLHYGECRILLESDPYEGLKYLSLSCTSCDHSFLKPSPSETANFVEAWNRFTKQGKWAWGHSWKKTAHGSGKLCRWSTNNAPFYGYTRSPFFTIMQSRAKGPQTSRAEVGVSKLVTTQAQLVTCNLKTWYRVCVFPQKKARQWSIGRLEVLLKKWKNFTKMLHSALSSLVVKRTGNGIGGEEKDARGKTCSKCKSAWKDLAKSWLSGGLFSRSNMIDLGETSCSVHGAEVWKIQSECD